MTAGAQPGRADVARGAAGPEPGLAHGLAVLRGALTRAPDGARSSPDLPVRSRGVIALLEENCTVCMLCARECPDWCVYIDSHQETVPAPSRGGRPRTRNVLDRFAIDFGLCMYCGICIEVCPFDALFWAPEHTRAEPGLAELTHERDRLREWLAEVPPPAALDPAAEPAPEALAVQSPVRAGGADSRSGTSRHSADGRRGQEAP